MSTPINNPYALTKEEQEQWNAWEAMSDDDKGEFIFSAKQELSNADYIAAKDAEERINSNVVQRLHGGGIQVGGALQADAIITIDGFEMTAQQAVDHGVIPADHIGDQTAHLVSD